MRLPAVSAQRRPCCRGPAHTQPSTPSVRAPLPQLPPDPGMQPTRHTRQRSCPQPGSLHAADIPGATAGRTDWLRPRKQPLDPLAPAYQWLPIREEPAPAPKFVRDTLDVSDIVGSKVRRGAGVGGHPPTLGHCRRCSGARALWERPWKGKYATSSSWFASFYPCQPPLPCITSGRPQPLPGARLAGGALAEQRRGAVQHNACRRYRGVQAGLAPAATVPAAPRPPQGRHLRCRWWQQRLATGRQAEQPAAAG